MSNARKRTYASYSQKRKDAQKAYVTKSRKKKKELLVEYKGGCCIVCGYDKCVEALDFHHVRDKSYPLTNHMTRSLDNLKLEADKCVLLCANCHREIHAGVTQLVE